MQQEQVIIIHTDGACKGNPGIGAWAAILEYGKHKKELSGVELDTTNNRMELQGAIEALKALTKPCKVELYTDSQYVQKGMTEWMNGWKTKNWKNVKNIDLWQELDEVARIHQINWQWVRGHNGHPGNERADELANLAIEKYKQNLLCSATK